MEQLFCVSFPSCGTWDESFRNFLYPIGFISTVACALRYLVQWYASEKKKESVLPKSFWYFSLIANGVLALHGFIQLQLVIFLLQMQLFLLGMRNISFFSSSSIKTKTFLYIVFGSTLLSFFLFSLQKFFTPEETFSYLRLPQIFGEQQGASFLLHTLGVFGFTALSFRYFLQWYESEKKKISHLSKRFFWTGIVGGVSCGIYSALIQDPVNLIGSIGALFPCIRNLMLQRTKKDLPKSDILFICGETSGDLLGADVIQALKKQDPTLVINGGIAGPAMREQGVFPFFCAEQFQVMGIFDVLKKAFFLYSALKTTAKNICKIQPKVVVTIDQPTFSLSLAKLLKKNGFSGKLVQIVAPTVWAYKAKRAKLFASYFDLILPLYRFETPYFSPLMKTVWAGHPIASKLSKKNFDTTSSLFALFPGSRTGEIKRNLPLQLSVALLVKEKLPDLPIAISVLPHTEKYIREMTEKKFPFPVEFVSFDKRYDLMSCASCAIATSGTVTLELALHKVPTICCYQTNLFSRIYAQYIMGISLKSFALPNILTGEKIIPEHILPPIDTKAISQTALSYIQSKTALPEKTHASLLQEIDAGEKSHFIMAKEIACLIP